ncbi:MAG: hypothetical protein WBP61_05720 [Nocardioides sp.]
MTSMSEQEIRHGFHQMSQALAPPMDAQERIDQRVRVRRRRRRTVVAGTAAVATLAVLGSAAALSGGDEPDGRMIATEPPAEPASTLLLTRPDGSTYPFPDVTISCEPPPLTGGDAGGGASSRIWAYSPMELTDPAGDEGDAFAAAPFVYIEGVVSKLQGDRTLTLPIDGPGGSQTYPLTVFIADTEGGPDGNEVASSAGGSGTVRVLEASCDPEPVLRLAIDGTLDSEEGKQALDLTGELR